VTSRCYVAESVESFPIPLRPGVVYVSLPSSTAAHICPCGCDSEVVTKLSPARYQVSYDGEVSIYPSIASTGLPCNSHYFITRGKVEWCVPLTPKQAVRAQGADRQSLDAQRKVAGHVGRFRRSWNWLSRR
jgi:hypothetical protein